MPHDFKNFPELTNNQMLNYYWESPHKQITEDFTAKVVKIHDGDTITLKWDERDFNFPLRLARIAAPEMNEEGGKESREWLASKLEGEVVDILINKDNRVEKWGRLLGEIIHMGLNMNNLIMEEGFAVPFEERNAGKILNINWEIKDAWF